MHQAHGPEVLQLHRAKFLGKEGNRCFVDVVEAPHVPTIELLEGPLEIMLDRVPAVFVEPTCKTVRLPLPPPSRGKKAPKRCLSHRGMPCRLGGAVLSQ